MIIRSRSFLPRRDFAIHEAAHYVIGVGFGLPMNVPEVFRNGTGGRTALDQPALQASSAGVVIEDFSSDQCKWAATRMGAVCLAGCAAEAISAGVDTSIIIGSHTEDLRQAVEVIRKVGQSDMLLIDAWRLAVKALHHAWPMVVEIAELLPVTDGSHRAVQLH